MAIVLRIIGDIHGRYLTYGKLIANIPQSICVGDVGFDYNYLIDRVDPNKHRSIAGNHDNYDIIDTVPHFMGDYGETNSPLGNIFFVRGAWSIDRKERELNDFMSKSKTIWEEQELTVEQGYQALDAYKVAKPNFVITHECPLDVVQYVTEPGFVEMFGYDQPIIKTRTNQLLQAMTDFHSPKIWCFGHYHKRWYKMINNTLFICVKDEECIDFRDNGNIHYGSHLLEYNWKLLLETNI